VHGRQGAMLQAVHGQPYERPLAVFTLTQFRLADGASTRAGK
jgi:hypothetical protein